MTMVLKPIGLILLLLAILPIRLAVQKYMRDGRLKRLLLYRFNP